MSRPLRDEGGRYGRISLVLHWVTALLVLALIVLGQLMEWTIGFDDQSLYARIKTLHIATGAVTAAVLLPRIAWRLYAGWGARLRQPRILMWSATAVQALLLVLIAFQAITGVLSRWTARDYPFHDAQSIPVYGLFEIPSPFPAADPEWNRTVEWFHDATAEIIIILLGLHVLGALKHRLLDRRRGVRRVPSRGKLQMFGFKGKARPADRIQGVGRAVPRCVPADCGQDTLE